MDQCQQITFMKLILPSMAVTNEYYILLEMIVEKMSTLTFVFLSCDNEEIYYPNSQLATNPFSTLYCCPNINDAVEFIVDVSTQIEILVH